MRRHELEHVSLLGHDAHLRGTLDAAGDVRFAKTFSLPVVGGTSAYAGAKGELTITQLTERKDRYAIELTD